MVASVLFYVGAAVASAQVARLRLRSRVLQATLHTGCPLSCEVQGVEGVDGQEGVEVVLLAPRLRLEALLAPRLLLELPPRLNLHSEHQRRQNQRATPIRLW